MRSPQRKHVIAIVAILSLVLPFTGCEDPTNSSTNPVTYLPALAPGGGATANGAIFWRIGTNDAQQDEADPAAFPPDFSGNGLSGWAAVTSLKN